MNHYARLSSPIHTLRVILSALLIWGVLFSVMPVETVLAAAYLDDFAVAPTQVNSTTFVTGTPTTGLSYVVSNCDFVHDVGNQRISSLSVTYPGQASITITSRDAGPFEFASVYIDTVEDLVISGTGSQPFTINISGGSVGTFSPAGGNKVVNQVVISNVGPSYIDFNIFLDTVSTVLNLPPEIDVQRPAATSIADGGTDNLGPRSVGSQTLTYFLDNTTGNGNLIVDDVTASNLTNVSNYSLSTATPINVNGGATGTFSISFDINANGAFSLDLTIPNNDADENPYNIHLSGTGDGTPPSLTSFTRQTPATTPTNANSLVFRATFNEAVQNVNTADFSVNSTSTSTVTNVATISTSVYDITVSGGDLASFNGDVGMNLAGSQNITDLVGNALPVGEPTTDQLYTLDNDPPGLTSFARQTPATSPTNADTLIFQATFDEPVQNVDTTDFGVFGTSTATVTNVTTVSTSIYNITVSGGNLASYNGVVGLNLAGGQNITDLAGNALPAGEPTTDETYTEDNDPPGLTSFAYQSPASSPTNADSLIFRVTFDEDVQNVSTEDFSVDGTTTATVTSVSPVSASVYDVTITGGDLASFNGIVGLNLDAAPNISDLVGNALPAGDPTTDETYTLDNLGPTVTINQAGGQLDPTTTSPINFTVVFDESVSDFATGDVNLSGTAGANTQLVTGSGTTYNVAVSGMTSDGTVIAALVSGVASDALGNPSAASTTSDNQVTFTMAPEMDIQHPALTSITDGGTDALGNQTVGTVNLTYTVDNTAGTDTLSISGVTASSLSNVSSFSMDTAVPINVAAGATSTFNVSFTVNMDGAFSLAMAIANNDSDENPYNITISGTGTGGVPEINMQRPSGTSILDGNTDNVSDQPIGTVNLTYTIDNTAGTGALSISGVTASNYTNASGFSLDTSVPIVVAPGLTDTFDISFNVPVNGAFSFDMSIANDDSDEDPYSITVSGAGTGGFPEMDLQRPPATSIIDGGTDALGSQPAGTVNLTYTVDNTAGTGTLTISAVTAANLVNASGFTLNTATPINIASGNTDTFSVSFTVPAADAFSLDMDISNNDPSEGNYDVAISGTGYIEPEISVSYNSVTITDNDATPATADGTDFGNDQANVAAYSPEHTFTITNSGAGVLNLGGSPRVTLTGTDFTLLQDAPVSINPGESGTFIIQFAATAAVVNDGTVSIANNDTDENPFNFSITGTGYNGALMIVQGGSPLLDIENGDNSPIPDDSTYFGVAQVASGSVDNTFVINNYGSGDLNLSGSPIVSIGGTNPGDFTVLAQPTTPIASGANQSFTIRYDPSAAGTRTALVSISNDDPNQNPYTFTIQGDTDEFQVVMGGNTVPGDGAILSTGTSTLRVQFNRAALSDGSGDAANSITNYLLVEDGADNIFDTQTCLVGVAGDDTALTISNASYDAGTRTATLTVNSAAFVAGGRYQLLVCGTASIYDTLGNELNGGATDTSIVFSIAATVDPGTATVLPATGFPIGLQTLLPLQPLAKSYTSSEMILEIPSLNQKMSIIGVPLVDGIWDVSWLGTNAGYLAGTAYPTWAGNTVLTGHVWDALNQPGPFARLKNLRYGELLKIHSGESVYIYEVRDNRVVKPSSIQAVIRHEELDWVTLITCEDFQESKDTYANRRIVRAVLVRVEEK